MPVDTNKPAELLLFDFFTAKAEAAVDGDAFYGDDFELHDTIYQTITKARGLRISDGISSPGPGPLNALREFNASVQIVCFAQVKGKNQKERATALQAAFDLEIAVIQALMDDTSLGNKVCDLRIDPAPRSFAVYDAKPYAVVNIPVVINPF